MKVIQEKFASQLKEFVFRQIPVDLGIGLSTLSRWRQQYAANDGTVPTRGSGNYASDEQKEIARLKRELRNAQDALDVLKKAIGILGND